MLSFSVAIFSSLILVLGNFLTFEIWMNSFTEMAFWIKVFYLNKILKIILTSLVQRLGYVFHMDFGFLLSPI